MRTREREFFRVKAAARHLAILVVLLLHCTGASSAIDSVREIVYSHYGQVAPYHILSTLQARRSHPKAKITVILHDDSDEDAWHDVAKGTGLNIWKPANWDTLEKFRAVYRHASINHYQKEMYCIYRHLILHQYMVESNATSFIYLDLDIALFDDLWKYIPPDSAVGALGTFGLHWTQRSLSEFARYLWHFYQREPIEIARHIAQIGRAGKQYDKALAEQRDTLLAWWPEEMQPYHLSDMWQFRDFVKKTKALKILCRNKQSDIKQCPPALQLMKNLRNFHKNVRDRMILASELSEQVKKDFDWQVHPLYGYPQPWLETLTVDNQLVRGPVPGIHFQGHSKGIMPYLLCDDLTKHFTDHQELQKVCRAPRT